MLARSSSDTTYGTDTLASGGDKFEEYLEATKVLDELAVNLCKLACRASGKRIDTLLL